MLYETANEHGGDIYSGEIKLDYSVNLNPLGNCDAVVNAIKEAASDAGVYPDPYCRKLIAAIAEKEGVSEKNIICGNGGAEIIYAYCDTVLPKRAAVAIPSFSEYSTAVLRNGAELVKYHTREDNGFALDEGMIDFIGTQRPDLLFLCNPNNPDGRLIPDELLDKILKICDETGCAVFLDECFLELSDGFDRSGISLINEHPGLFILRAFTKTFSMAGIRLGYGISADTELLKRISQRLQPWNVSVIAQKAGLAALNEQSFIEAGRITVMQERSRFSQQLSECGIKVCESQANYMLIKIPEEVQSGDDDTNDLASGSAFVKDSFGDRMLQKGILIRNCRNFEGLGRGWYRICIKGRADNDFFLKTVRSVL